LFQKATYFRKLKRRFGNEPQLAIENRKQPQLLVRLDCDAQYLFIRDKQMLVHHINSCNQTKLLQSF
jgi:hypothetical protein